eukprot:GHVQ01024944.1.p1 GENE.GHVQ01024944.1~~GHVQ01024944.1.p1  ORF type:complete len:326 (-),score=57.73 GHVQ01024944.1:1447-2424(-)
MTCTIPTLPRHPLSSYSANKAATAAHHTPIHSHAHRHTPSPLLPPSPDSPLLRPSSFPSHNLCSPILSRCRRRFSVHNYHKVMRPLPDHVVKEGNDLVRMLCNHAIGPLLQDIATAKQINDWKTVGELEEMARLGKEQVESSTVLWEGGERGAGKEDKEGIVDEGEGRDNNDKEEEKEDLDKVDSFSVFGHPPSIHIGEVLNKDLYGKGFQGWKRGSHVCMYFAKKNLNIRTIDHTCFIGVMDDYVEGKSMIKGNWRGKPVLDERLEWCRMYGGHSINWEDQVSFLEKCFCPTPNPSMKWQWNFAKISVQQQTKDHACNNSLCCE